MNRKPFQSLSRVLIRFYTFLFKRKCQVPEEHELNQIAHEILQVIHLRRNNKNPEEQDPVEVEYPPATALPILDLLLWAENSLWVPDQRQAGDTAGNVGETPESQDDGTDSGTQQPERIPGTESEQTPDGQQEGSTTGGGPTQQSEGPDGQRESGGTGEILDDAIARTSRLNNYRMTDIGDYAGNTILIKNAYSTYFIWKEFN